MKSLKEILDIISFLKMNYTDLENRTYDSLDPFRTLIGCLLSHRTRDTNARKAVDNLFKIIETPEDIQSMDIQQLKNAIKCSGLYNQKSRTIRNICITIINEFDGKIPSDRTTLMGIHGIGPKTADIVLSHAYLQPAIAVDVHVSRVAKRLGLVKSNATPEIVKGILENIVPSSDYRFIDNAFVRHGKIYCRKNGPKCKECFLNQFCNFSNTQSE